MSKDFKTKFGLRIKELRRANGLTQEKLAEEVCMERVNLAKIEGGKQFPNVENLEKFALVFNLEIDELFNFKHQKTKEELIKEINRELSRFSIEKIQYIYKSTMNIKILNS